MIQYSDNYNWVELPELNWVCLLNSNPCRVVKPRTKDWNVEKFMFLTAFIVVFNIIVNFSVSVPIIIYTALQMTSMM